MRTFIAVDLAPNIKARCTELLRKLRWHGPRGITWAREEGMHLTLKFLGEIDETLVSSVTDVLARVAASCPAFPLTLRGTGFFPAPPRTPRVIWIGTEESPSFAELEQSLETGLEALGFPRETRPFHPHLTVGRVKNPSGIRPVLAELSKFETAEFGNMIVRAVTLFQSHLKPSGAEYSVLAKGLLA